MTHAQARGGTRWTRRRVLTLGLASAAAAGAAGVSGLELISRGIVPGKLVLDTLDGACSVPAPILEFGPVGPSFSRTFYSAARRRTVGYTIAYPPRHRAGSDLPLVVMLHGYGGNHADAGRSLRWRWSPWTAATATGIRTPATTRWRW
jgi:poly(3-hydroxybutyrate) depolymerase